MNQTRKRRRRRLIGAYRPFTLVLALLSLLGAIGALVGVFYAAAFLDSVLFTSLWLAALVALGVSCGILVSIYRPTTAEEHAADDTSERDPSGMGEQDLEPPHFTD
ncbi:MAG: hypothetical protein KDD44_00455 [Bdellovibrionales bacterium]|nr:hypothetical protein [Bdellovibrionales bacterium]